MCRVDAWMAIVVYWVLSRTGVKRDHATRVRPAGKLAFCCGVAPPLLLLPRVRCSRDARRFVCRVTRLRGGMNHVNVL